MLDEGGPQAYYSPMRHWIVLIVLVLSTVGYVYQTQFAGKKKASAAAAAAAQVPVPAVDAATRAMIQGFLAKAVLRSTLIGPPDIAIIDGRQISEGGVLPAAPGIDLEVRDVGDGFVLLAYKDQVFRLEKSGLPVPAATKPKR